MSANATVNQVVLIGDQAAADTPVTPDMQFSGLNVDFDEQLETNFYRPAGSKVNKMGVLNDVSSKGTFNGVHSYREAIWPFESYVGSGGGPDTLAGGGKKWRYKPSLGDVDPYVLFTIQKGSKQRGRQVNDILFNSIQIALSRKGVNISGNILGKGVTPGVTMNLERNEVQSLAKTGTPTAGTFTLTYSGQTTSAIAYNASAATIKAALEALSNIAVGDVSVSGGPLPNTAVVITFKGALGNTNVGAITVDSTSVTGGTFAITTTTQGNAGATEIAPMPIAGKQVSLFLDDAYGDIGTTQLTDNFSCQINLPDKYRPKSVMNRDLDSYKEPVEQPMEPTCVLTMEANSFSDALYAAAKAGDLPTQYLRIDAEGIVIGGGVTDPFQWVFDVPLKLQGATENGDSDGVDSYTFTFQIVEDDDMGSFFDTYFVNDIASL
ncbi:MAG TPA: hypothetical protein VGB17_06940 [Pyrinomonadaceae bacterium]|jgi:hypothetical protein